MAPATLIGLPPLCQIAFDGHNLAPIWNNLIHRLEADRTDAAPARSRGHCRTSRPPREPPDPAVCGSETAARIPAPAPIAVERPLRLLAFMAPGDFMANAPLEFLLQGSSIALEIVYAMPGSGLPPVPEHDLAFVAIDESDATAPVLQELSTLLAAWPRPVLNRPDRIVRLSRAGTWQMLHSAAGVVMPKNARVDRSSSARRRRCREDSN